MTMQGEGTGVFLDCKYLVVIQAIPCAIDRYHHIHVKNILMKTVLGDSKANKIEQSS